MENSEPPYDLVPIYQLQELPRTEQGFLCYFRRVGMHSRRMGMNRPAEEHSSSEQI
jgi:hypothetical protein